MLGNGTSAYGSDKVDQADASRELEMEEALRRETAPITYQVMAIVNDVEIIEEFTCERVNREARMRGLGIQLDNHPWALRSKSLGRWGEPIGRSDELKRKLKKLR